jgi:hypothetical protein
LGFCLKTEEKDKVGFYGCFSYPEQQTFPASKRKEQKIGEWLMCLAPRAFAFRAERRHFFLMACCVRLSIGETMAMNVQFLSG